MLQLNQDTLRIHRRSRRASRQASTQYQQSARPVRRRRLAGCRCFCASEREEPISVAPTLPVPRRIAMGRYRRCFARGSCRRCSSPYRQRAGQGPRAPAAAQRSAIDAAQRASACRDGRTCQSDLIQRIGVRLAESIDRRGTAVRKRTQFRQYHTLSLYCGRTFQRRSRRCPIPAGC